MRIALSDLGLEKIIIIYPGEKRYSLAEKIEVVPIRQIFSLGRERGVVEQRRWVRGDG